MQILRNLQNIWTGLRDFIGGNKNSKETAQPVMPPGQGELFDLKALVIVFQPADPDEHGRNLPDLLGLA